MEPYGLVPEHEVLFLVHLLMMELLAAGFRCGHALAYDEMLQLLCLQSLELFAGLHWFLGMHQVP